MEAIKRAAVGVAAGVAAGVFLAIPALPLLIMRLVPCRTAAVDSGHRGEIVTG